MIPIAIISIIIFPPWHGIFTWISPLPDTVDQQVEDAVDRGLDGIIVYVDTEGQPVRTYTAGVNNREKNQPANPDALFKIASIAKLYDAVVLTKLVDDGLINLDDKLSDFYPELEGKIEYINEITIEMMVKHRSGLPNFTDQEEYRWDAPPANAQASLELIFDVPADFEPDEEYAYSNTNYLLLAEVMNQVLGYDKFEYLRKEVLIPQGLNRTFAQLSDVDIDHVMKGYYVGVEEDFTDLDFGMLATAEDVGLFIRALNEGSFFNENEKAIYDSIYEYGHKGWVLGYQSIAYYHEDIDTVVVQFVNTVSNETELTTQVVYDRIVRILRKNLLD